MKNNKQYQVINIRTKDVVGSYSTRKAAQRRADKMDLEYGAINYAVKNTEFVPAQVKQPVNQ